MDRRILDLRGHAHFVTFSCYKRRRILDDDRAKGIVFHFLSDGLQKHEGSCIGFVIMPDHVHALLSLDENGMLSGFMQQWKRRSSIQLKKFLNDHIPEYVAKIDPREPIWQARFMISTYFPTRKQERNLNTCTTILSEKDWFFGQMSGGTVRQCGIS